MTVRAGAVVDRHASLHRVAVRTDSFVISDYGRSRAADLPWDTEADQEAVVRAARHVDVFGRYRSHPDDHQWDGDSASAQPGA